jgi:hypothetical protein
LGLTLALASCWLGVGLWLLADEARLRRLSAVSLSRAGALALRLSGGGLVLGAGIALERTLGGALATPALLVLTMAALSLAVLMFPLWPRWYAASLPMALALALAALGA